MAELRDREPQGRQIGGHDGINIRTFYLGDDLLAPPQHRAVGLPKGRRGERLPVESRVYVLEWAVKRLLDHNAHLVEIDRRHLILEEAQLLDVLVGKQIHAGTEELP